ncbi:MAG: hypothetical protein Q9223_006558 [Gallowayella weberi]
MFISPRLAIITLIHAVLLAINSFASVIFSPQNGLAAVPPIEKVSTKMETDEDITMITDGHFTYPKYAKFESSLVYVNGDNVDICKNTPIYIDEKNSPGARPNEGKAFNEQLRFDGGARKKCLYVRSTDAGAGDLECDESSGEAR